MVLNNRDIAVIGTFGGFLAWAIVTEYFPVVRYVVYSFLYGGLSMALIFGASIVLNVRRNDSFRAKWGKNDIFLSLQGRSMAFLSHEKWEHNVNDYRQSLEYKPQPICQSQVLSGVVDELLRLLQTQFIASWYRSISPNYQFVNEIDRVIRGAICQIRDRLDKIDIVEFVVARIVPILTNHLKDYDKAERAVRGRNLSRTVTEEDELEIAIASKYREGRIHPAASTSFSDPRQAQQEYLRKIIITSLPLLVPSALLKSRAVAVLLREIVTCSVLAPILSLLSDPDTWNQLIEAYGRTALQDRKTVKKLRAALAQHASSPTANSKQTASFPQLRPESSERDFERFVRAIRRCNNLSDARRFRNYFSSQLKRESMVEGQDILFIQRLETGKRVLDQKVAKLSTLGGENGRPTSSNTNELQHHYYSKINDVFLVDIMHNPTGLPYFMEFMDRLGKMSLVQFWVVVDGFRNPLEDDFGDDNSKVKWTASDRNDVLLISETYLSRPELNVPPASRRIVKEFLDAGKRGTSDQYRKARTVILAMQSAILEEMQNTYYPKFKKSELYFKYLAADEAASTASMASSNSVPAQRRVSSSSDIEPRPRSRLSTRPLPQPGNTQNTAPEFRRARTYTGDTTATSSSTGPSLDGNMPRPPLFDDDVDNNALAFSAQSISANSTSGEGDNSHQNEVIESVEAALNDIIANRPNDLKPEESKQPSATPAVSRSPRSLFESPTRPDSAAGGRPNIASLGLVNPVGRIGVFADNDLFPDEEKFIEDEYADPVPDDEDSIAAEIRPAEPGDLGLREAISALTIDIEKLLSQETVVDALTKKAELTNNTLELRILGKSRASLQREIRRKEMQRQQYIIQESDTGLYGRASVHIQSIFIGKEEDGHEFASYLIEVQRKAGDQMPAASWSVPRRYSEFHSLHQRLRIQHSAVRGLEFPRRRVVMKLQKDFLQKRRAALESYLQQLLLLPEVCRSRELRSFLSQRAFAAFGGEEQNGSIDPNNDAIRDGSKDLVSRFYSSVADGMDDFLGNIAVLDQLSTAGQNLLSAATSQFNHNGGNDSNSASRKIPGQDNVVSAAEAEAELNAFSEDQDRENVEQPFVKPICDIFLEIFELNRGNNWLRGRAVVVVLHQLLGSTVERKTRETTKQYLSEVHLSRYVSMAKDSLFPENPEARARKGIPRTQLDKNKSKVEASMLLTALIPDVAGSVVGKANAQAAARKVFATLNNERLSVHLWCMILDEIVAVLFGKGA